MAEVNGNGNGHKARAAVESVLVLWVARVLTPVLLTGLLGVSVIVGRYFVEELHGISAKLDTQHAESQAKDAEQDNRITRVETRLDYSGRD